MKEFSLTFDPKIVYPKGKGGIEESFKFFLSMANWHNGGKPKYFTVKRGTGTAIQAFKSYENGVNQLQTKDPKRLHAAIKGKAAWGLWSKEYAIGIATFLTTWEELETLNIPNKFMNDIFEQAHKLRYS
jgi:hypothetical protein